MKVIAYRFALLVAGVGLVPAICAHAQTTKPSETPPPSRMIALHPEVPVRDVSTSVKHYKDVLGFKVELEWGDPPQYAILSRDNVRIGLMHDPDRVGTSRIYIAIENIQDYFEEVNAAGAHTDGEPREMPWGMREFELIDPGGNRIRFGEQKNQ